MASRKASAPRTRTASSGALLLVLAAAVGLGAVPATGIGQWDPEGALIGPEGARVWKLEPIEGLAVPDDLSVVLQGGGPDVGIDLFAHDAESTWAGDLVIEPDESRVVISLTLELPGERLDFQGAVTPDGRAIEGLCRRGRDAAECRLVREDSSPGSGDGPRGTVERGLPETDRDRPVGLAGGRRAPLPIPGMQIREMRFFESPWAGRPVGERSYATRFEASGARVINYELRFEFPPLARDTSFDIEVFWYREGGGELTRMPRTVTVEAGWDRVGCWQGWGAAEPGAWVPGRYRVQAFAGGELLAEGEFEVIRPPDQELPMSPVHSRERQP